MQSGKLRHQIQIHVKTETRGASGGVIKTPARIGKVWASIAPLRTSETFAAQAVQSTVTHRITIRHFEGLTTDHRIVFGTRNFEINSVRNIDERNRMMEVMAVEKV